MIVRKFKTIQEAWRGLIRELAYGDSSRPEFEQPLISGHIVSCFPDIISVEIENVLKDESLHLGMSSYTKVRWNKFLRRYFRPDLTSWIDSTVEELNNLNNKYQVSSYSIEPNPVMKWVGRGAQGGHRHGSCLASLQIQSYPEPRIIVMSRAAQIDRAGFLDLALMHLVAERTKWLAPIKGVWIVSNASITAANQIYHVPRFGLSLKGHHLAKCVNRFTIPDWRQSKYGPQKRMLKRIEDFKKFGEIPRSCFIRELSLEFESRKV